MIIRTKKDKNHKQLLTTHDTNLALLNTEGERKWRATASSSCSISTTLYNCIFLIKVYTMIIFFNKVQHTLWSLDYINISWLYVDSKVTLIEKCAHGFDIYNNIPTFKRYIQIQRLKHHSIKQLFSEYPFGIFSSFSWYYITELVVPIMFYLIEGCC